MPGLHGKLHQEVEGAGDQCFSYLHGALVAVTKEGPDYMSLSGPPGKDQGQDVACNYGFRIQ